MFNLSENVSFWKMRSKNMLVAYLTDVIYKQIFKVFVPNGKSGVLPGSSRVSNKLLPSNALARELLHGSIRPSLHPFVLFMLVEKTQDSSKNRKQMIIGYFSQVLQANALERYTTVSRLFCITITLYFRF